MLVIITGRLAFEEDLGLSCSGNVSFVRLIIVTERSQISKLEEETVGKKYRIALLLGIAFLCVIREAFFAATAKDTKQVSTILAT